MSELREIGLMTRLALGGLHRLSGPDALRITDESRSWSKADQVFLRCWSGKEYRDKTIAERRRAYERGISDKAIIDASQPEDVRDEWVGERPVRPKAKTFTAAERAAAVSVVLGKHNLSPAAAKQLRPGPFRSTLIFQMRGLGATWARIGESVGICGERAKQVYNKERRRLSHV